MRLCRHDNRTVVCLHVFVVSWPVLKCCISATRLSYLIGISASNVLYPLSSSVYITHKVLRNIIIYRCPTAYRYIVKLVDSVCIDRELEFMCEWQRVADIEFMLDNYPTDYSYGYHQFNYLKSTRASHHLSILFRNAVHSYDHSFIELLLRHGACYTLLIPLASTEYIRDRIYNAHRPDTLVFSLNDEYL